MMRVIAVAFVVLVLAVVGGYLYVKNRGVDIVITQEEIDREMKARFPMNKPLLMFFEVVYSNPEVTLLPDSQRVRVGLDAAVKVKGQASKFGGGATLTGRVDYRPETFEFYLADVKVERLAVDGISPEQLRTLNEPASMAAEEYVRRYPIYLLKANDRTGGTARMLLKNVKVRNREVVVTLGL